MCRQRWPYDARRKKRGRRSTALSWHWRGTPVAPPCAVMQHGLVLPRALPSGGCALLLARRPSRAGVAPPQHAHAGGGGKRPAAKRRKAAAPPLPVYEGEGSEYFLFARKAEERCAHPHAPFCAPIAALSVARRWMPLGDMVVSEDTQPGLVLAQRCAVTAQRPPRLGIRCCGRLHPVRRSFLTARAFGATQVRCPEEGGADEVAHAGAAPRGPGLRARLAAAARTRPRGNQARAISRRVPGAAADSCHVRSATEVHTAPEAAPEGDAAPVVPARCVCDVSNAAAAQAADCTGGGAAAG